VNQAVLSVAVTADGEWHLSVAAADDDAERGHMRLIGAPSVVLSSPMQVGTPWSQPSDLTGPTPVLLARGATSATILIDLQQSVGATDAPGTYGIDLVIAAISGF
jgi:hypothetical protein